MSLKTYGQKERREAQGELLLVEICPDVREEYEDQEHNPTCECAKTPGKTPLVQK
jgi:hypothetical protein